MRLGATLTFSCVLSLILSFTFPAFAGPLPPCIKAASSEDGNFVVLMDVHLDLPQSDEGAAGRNRQHSFEVYAKENFINSKDRLTAPGTYFSQAQWGVALDSRDTSCRWLPLVTDDGEFVILLAQTPGLSVDEVVLQIYRWDSMSKVNSRGGRLIGEIPLRKLYIPLEISCCTSESPEWFAGGSFSFSADNRQLIYTSRYGNTVRITLSDGSVSSK